VKRHEAFGALVDRIWHLIEHEVRSAVADNRA